MAKRKTCSLATRFMRLIAGLAIIILIVGSALFVANYYLNSPQPEHHTVKKHTAQKHTAQKHTVQKHTVKKSPMHSRPVYEVFPVEKKQIHKPVSLPVVRRPGKLPRVAIIIDDIGYDRLMAEKFLKLDARLTFSVLPYSPFGKQFVDSARRKGTEIMLHLPMEPVEYPKVDPGKGALLTSMSPDQLIDMLSKDLDCIPSIRGVNNHMGSKMTAESEKMNQIFSILKKRGLFFIDSRTTADTLCRSSARLLQIPFAQRDIFIDHRPDYAFIRKQVNSLIHTAISQGEAVGIAHPHQETYKVLSEMLPKLKNKVKLVPASAIVHTPS
ncbi:MAG: divergent polysaccharide deacetylase family protein [Desulfosarcina sp.]|nr:divergent polysaccharide deacetylase family protein [Desulfobacterales bacterium]